MENQENQNIQPDYDFILNQPGGQPTPQTPLLVPRRGHKKLIIVAICAFVLLVGLAVVTALVAKPSATPATNNSVSVSQLDNPVDHFLAALRQQDYAKAASYLPGDSQAQATSAVNLKTTFSAVNLASCKVTPLQGDKLNSSSDLTCRQADNKYGIVMHFQISDNDNKPLILTYSVKAVV